MHSAAAGFLRDGSGVADTAKALAEIARANTAAWMRATLEHAAQADGIVCRRPRDLRWAVVRGASAHSGSRCRPAADDADSRISIAVRAAVADAGLGQPVQPPARAGDDVARVPRRAQRRAARRYAASATPHRVRRLSGRLRHFADARPAPPRLARAFRHHRPMDSGNRSSMVAATGTGGVPGRGRTAGVHRLRQHGRFRSRSVPLARARRAGGPSRAALRGLERLRRRRVAVQRIGDRADAARLAAAANPHRRASRWRGDDARSGARRRAVSRRAVRRRPAVLGRSAAPRGYRAAGHFPREVDGGPLARKPRVCRRSELVAQARAIGEAMAGEDGVAEAVGRIVRALERRRV